MPSFEAPRIAIRWFNSVFHSRPSNWANKSPEIIGSEKPFHPHLEARHNCSGRGWISSAFRGAQNIKYVCIIRPFEVSKCCEVISDRIYMHNYVLRFQYLILMDYLMCLIFLSLRCVLKGWGLTLSPLRQSRDPPDSGWAVLPHGAEILLGRTTMQHVFRIPQWFCKPYMD